jgi:hypothetical protein
MQFAATSASTSSSADHDRPGLALVVVEELDCKAGDEARVSVGRFFARLFAQRTPVPTARARWELASWRTRRGRLPLNMKGL